MADFGSSLMLDHAILYRNVFTQYAAQDANRQWVPSNEEWELAENICDFLEVFNNATKLFSSEKYSTSNCYLLKIWCIRKVLVDNASSDDQFMKRKAILMGEKFDKYWGDVKAILDPRYKLVLIEFVYSQLHGPSECKSHVEYIKTILYKIFSVYVEENEAFLTKTCRKQASEFPGSSTSDIRRIKVVCNDYNSFVMKKTNPAQRKSDLDIYFEEDVLIGDNIEKLDILDWWKENDLKFKILSKMTKDILTIPLTNVASKFTFSAGGRVLDQYRSSLAPQTMNILICTSS